MDTPDLSRPDFWIVWRCYGIPYVHFYFYCLEAALRQDTYKSDFRHCYGNFVESATPKVTRSQLSWSFFSTIARHINNSIFKDTLRLKILWIWIKIRGNSFTKTFVNNMKWKSMKVFILKMLLCHVLFPMKKS